MEMEPKPPAVAKKLWNVVRVLFYMLKKGILKRKLLIDLNLMFKRSKLAGKAISDLMIDQYSSFTCRSKDSHLSFISPREYEFSCSNSPAFQFQFHPFHLNKRKNHHHYHHHYDDVSTVTAVQKVLEMLNNEKVDASPLTLPGFGKSPLVRQLRVTDSPFPLKETEENSHVDMAAEEFIKKFYKNLKSEKRKLAIESPYRNTWDR